MALVESMAAPATDFGAPFQQDLLLEVRTSKMKRMPGLTIESGIDKTLCPGPMKVDKLGLQGDEHDPTFHGGPNKAILGYCSAHYKDWQHSFPERADRFVPGGFGENFVTSHMNERNVCVGDIIAVGPEVVLQVSQPRQPCFKLNHRFSLKNFAPKTYESSRTGWYYRVIKEGTVEVGNEIRLVERAWPQWTIERVQEYLHRDKENLDMNKELANLEVMADEIRNQFKKRVAKAAKANQPKKSVEWKDFKVAARSMETDRVVSIVLQAVTPDPDHAVPSYGAHAKIKLPNGLVRTYSVVSGDDDFCIRDKFTLGIALEANSRGGSKYIHESVHIGDIIQVARFTTDFQPVGSASNHVFIVGGIGITAFLTTIEAARDANWSCELHYAVRGPDDVPFKSRLEAMREYSTVYEKSSGQRMDVKGILKNMPWNSHVYVCGPDRLMQAAREAVEECGLAPEEVSYEAFAADITGDPFEAVIANRDHKVVKVAEEETLLEVLRREFDDVASSCEVGNCGTCKIGLKEGRVDHRGTGLSDEEKKQSLLSCVSRGIGRITIEI